LGPWRGSEKVNIHGDVEVIVFETQVEAEVKGGCRG
jgi:hypothetical protein